VIRRLDVHCTELLVVRVSLGCTLASLSMLEFRSFVARISSFLLVALGLELCMLHESCTLVHLWHESVRFT
jgi:hypothetical protein